jgi:hypothetical protein
MKRVILLLFLALIFTADKRAPETLAGAAIARNAVEVDGVIYIINDNDLMVNETYVLQVYGGRVLRCVDLEIYELENMD